MRNRALPVIALLVWPALTPGAAHGQPCDSAGAKGKVDAAIKARTREEMARLAREAIALCDSYAPAHNVLGTAHEESGDLARAGDEYVRAASLDPTWYLPVVGLGDVARKQGKAAVAGQHYERALNLARQPAERSQVEAALRDLRDPGDGGYSFKTADTITRGLRIGSGSRSPGVFQEEPAKDPAKGPAYSDDCFQDTRGVGCNFTILFEVNSATLLPEARRQLDEIGKALKGASATDRFLIEGHASSEGLSQRNQRLSEERAGSVRQYLTRDFGIAPTQLEAVGRGTSNLVMAGGVEDRPRSRRVTVIRRWDQP